MGKLVRTIVILFSMVMATAAVHGIAEDPKAVEKWFEKLTHLKQKLTKFHFYYHDILSGKNPTSVQVAGFNVSAKSPFLFGLINMFDDKLTLGPNITSKQLGRAQGIYGASSLEEVSNFITMNLVFTDEKYNGSTLALLGRDPVFDRYREMSIVGGTGFFRLAQGIATASTYSFNATPNSAVLEFHVIVIHY
ncbi:hypothetical protein CsSME_00009214 [Camellia sinensis var. sinensis]|uniref:Dirigent protein n=1 Tax=Camellia sinensis var. sinensis TaxID=542762 RepID=A0A4S4CXR1_CAMSN|nr:dirigent protein 21-like [Camellia sinensis]THF94468.1 hypothetical protein TEA_009476 [Camellia sinensis var. sinensis]